MIIGFTGNRGSGKTLSLCREAYIKYREGYIIYSNFKLNFPYKKFTIQDILEYANNNKKFSRSLFCMDEAGVLIDSRSSMRDVNKVFSYFIAQTRKKDVDLYYCVQFSRMIDVRLRMHTDMIIQCLSKSIIVMHEGDKPIIRNNYQMKGNEYKIDVFVLNRCIEFSFDGKDKVCNKMFYGNKYFDIYDTSEVITPLEAT